MAWSHREIRDDLNGTLVCMVCGQSTNGMLMLREWDSGECQLFCRKHSRAKEWIEHNEEQRQFAEKMKKKDSEDRKQLVAMIQNADNVSYWWDDDCIVIHMNNHGGDN